MAYVLTPTLTLAIALLGYGGAVLAAPLAACPQKGGLLESASVFDGPPEKLVELMPDFATLEWDLSAGQESARARGESIYLVCKYKGTRSTVKIKLVYEAASCKAEGIKNRTVISCSAAPRMDPPPHNKDQTTTEINLMTNGKLHDSSRSAATRAATIAPAEPGAQLARATDLETRRSPKRPYLEATGVPVH